MLFFNENNPFMPQSDSDIMLHLGLSMDGTMNMQIGPSLLISSLSLCCPPAAAAAPHSLLPPVNVKLLPVTQY